MVGLWLQVLMTNSAAREGAADQVCLFAFEMFVIVGVGALIFWLMIFLKTLDGGENSLVSRVIVLFI